MTRRIGLLVLAAIMVATFGVPAAFGGELDSELTEVQRRISTLQSQISDSATERSTLAQKLIEVGDRLGTAGIAFTAATASSQRLDSEIAAQEAELDVIRADLASLLSRLSRTRGTRDSARREAEAWAIQAYIGGGSAQPSIAFSASAIVDVSVGVAYLDVLTKFSASAADRYSAVVATEELEESEVRLLEDAVVRNMADLMANKTEFDVAAGTLATTRDTLAQELAGHQTLLNDIDAAIDEFEGELAGLSREQASIRSKIASAAAVSVPSEPSPSVASPTPARASGGFVRPVPGAIESGFGPRVHPITGKTRMHTGLDMHGSAGTSILAAEDGKVIFAGVKGGYGKATMIDHGRGVVTLYAHQSRLIASVGQKVVAGDVIGLVGSTGLSTGPHLHFEVRINGQPVNAAPYL